MARCIRSSFLQFAVASGPTKTDVTLTSRAFEPVNARIEWNEIRSAEEMNGDHIFTNQFAPMQVNLSTSHQQVLF